MTWVRTRCDYLVEVDEDVTTGDWVDIHIPPPNELPYEISETDIEFLAQACAARKPITKALAEKYGVPTDLSVLPEYVFEFDEYQITRFVSQAIRASGTLFLHRSGTGQGDVPEVWIALSGEQAARQVQNMLLRLEIHTRVYWHPQRKLWMVQTRGQAAYCKIRPMVLDSKVPLLLKRMPVLDAEVLVGLKIGLYRIIKAQVKTVLDGPVDGMYPVSASRSLPTGTTNRYRRGTSATILYPSTKSNAQREKG